MSGAPIFYCELVSSDQFDTTYKIVKLEDATDVVYTLGDLLTKHNCWEQIENGELVYSGVHRNEYWDGDNHYMVFTNYSALFDYVKDQFKDPKVKVVPYATNVTGVNDKFHTKVNGVWYSETRQCFVRPKPESEKKVNGFLVKKMKDQMKTHVESYLKQKFQLDIVIKGNNNQTINNALVLAKQQNLSLMNVICLDEKHYETNVLTVPLLKQLMIRTHFILEFNDLIDKHQQELVDIINNLWTSSITIIQTPKK